MTIEQLAKKKNRTVEFVIKKLQEAGYLRTKNDKTNPKAQTANRELSDITEISDDGIIWWDGKSEIGKKISNVIKPYKKRKTNQDDEGKDENIQRKRLYPRKRYPDDFERNQFGHIFFGASFKKAWHIIDDDSELEGSPTENKEELFAGLFEYTVLDSDFDDNNHWVIISNSDEPNHFCSGDVSDIEADYNWFVQKDDLYNWIEKYKNGDSIRKSINSNFNCWFKDNKENYKPLKLEKFQIKRIIDSIESDVIERCTPKFNKTSSRINKPVSLSGCMFDRSGKCCCEDSRYYGTTCINTCDEFYRA